jgi:hypothetical protein
MKKNLNFKMEETIKQRKKQFRFSYEDNVRLLKDIIYDNPYLAKHGEAGKKWETIKNRFNLTLKDNEVSAH